MTGGARRRQRRNLIIGLVVGSLSAAIMGGLIYWFNTK